MFSFRFIFAGSLLAALATVSPAQTPKKIIDDYLHALGSATAVAGLRTRTITGSLTEEAIGATGSWMQIEKAPDSFYWQVIVGPEVSEEAYNGMSGWAQNAGQGALTLTGAGAKAAEAVASYTGAFPEELKKDKLNIQLVGLETVRGRSAYHIQIVRKTGPARDIFFDVGTHLVVREIAPDGNTFDYSDYRTASGIQTPYRIDLHRGGHDYKIVVTRAEYNAPVNDSVFGFPSVKATPLPDITTLLREVTQNQKAIEELQKQYTCHLSTENQEVDAKGQIKSVTTLEYDVFHIAGEDVQHLLAKDGKPLTADEKKKEDQRFNKQFESLTKKENELAVDPKKRAQQDKQDAKDDAQISDFLRAERFTNPRRERFRGEDVIAFDFGPNPDFKPKSMIENVVQKLTGVIWIDDRAHDVVRVDAHFNSSVKIGASILASVEKGTNFVFEQARVNGEVWLPSYDETHISGRLLFFKGNVNQIDRYSDYKKFHAESKIINVEN